MDFNLSDTSKGFKITLSAVAVLIFYSLFIRTSPEQTEQKIIGNFQQEMDAHYSKVMATVDELPITDANLLKCISLSTSDRAKIPVTSSGFITHANQLKLISCPQQKITAITGIGVLTQLTYLDVSANNISDLSPLKNHSSLKTLDIRDNPVTDIKPLSSLSNLNTVQLPKLSDIPCDTIKNILKNVTYSSSATACEKPVNSNLVTSKPTVKTSQKPEPKELTRQQEQEMMEYEMRYQ